MDVTRFRRLQAAYDASKGLSPTELATRLDQLRAIDPALADELIALRRDFAAAAASGTDDTPALRQILGGTALAEAAAGLQDAGLVAADLDDHAPTIPGFRLLRRLGQGGMGVVYEAEQESPRRRVALKLMRGALGSGRERRFELEAAVLARLHHPNIAQLYSCGTCHGQAGEQPYFAMERIDGVDLRTYAARARLDLAARLTLFAQVVDGVQHAHERGVVHRDLKPDNVLVDDHGTPKVLDFGVARAADSSIDLASGATQAGDLVGTLAYMAPEQLAGDPDAVTARTDVYALGVMLYELLGGRLPHEVAGLPIAAAIAVLSSHAPAPLARFDAELRGDVATIVGKAMDPDPTARYASADALAADIRRHLDHLPILARPASTWYQARKFVRRHRGLVTAVGALIAVLLLGLAGTGYGLREALAASVRETTAKTAAQQSAADAIAARNAEVAQREKAERERDKSEGIRLFLGQMLLGIDQSVGLGRDTELLVAMLDSAARRIEAGEMAKSPQAELYLRVTVGALFLTLQRPADAARMLEPAVALANTHAADTMQQADLLGELAALQRAKGDPRGAAARYREAVALWERVAPGDNANFATCLHHFSLALHDVGEFSETLAVARRALAMLQRVRPDDTWKHRGPQKVVAEALAQLGKLEEAETTLRQFLAEDDARGGDSGMQRAPLLATLGTVLQQRGNLDGALAAHQECLPQLRRMYRGDHEVVAAALSNLASVLVARRDLAAAEPLATESLAMYRRLFPGDHPRVAATLNNLGHLLQQKGDLAGAEPNFREALEMLKRLLPGKHPSLPALLHNLACLLQAKQDLVGAEPLFEDALARMQSLFPQGHPNLALCLFNLAKLQRDLGDLEQAEDLHRQALAMRRQLFPKGHFAVEQSLFTLGELLRQRGDAAGGDALQREANELRERLGMKPR